MRLRKTPAAIAASVAAAALAIAGCSSSGSSSAGSTSSSAAPAQLTVWRMGSSTPAQVTWMNSVISQFHKQYPAYAKTKVKVVFIPWTNRTQDWTNALSSGKNAPDITELGNTDTPTQASLGMLANITTNVNSWSNKSNVVSGMLANDTQSGTIYAVPWFGGVRGIWYRTDQFKAAGISSPPTSWADLVTDAKKLMAKFPGTYGLGAPTYDTPAVASFIWGAGGQIAVEQNGKWVGAADLPAVRGGHQVLRRPVPGQPRLPGQVHRPDRAGQPRAPPRAARTRTSPWASSTCTSTAPWASGTFPANAEGKSQWASFPIPSQSGPNPAPAFAGGSDLAVWSGSKYKTAAWNLVQVMDSVPNSTSFANSQGFFPPYTSQLTGGSYSSSQLLSGFAKAATDTQISPMNAKNWATADATDLVIPTMMKQLMKGANFDSTVAAANTKLQDVLNNGSQG